MLWRLPKGSVEITMLFFFKGTTPWTGCSALVPYFAYTDVCFHTYFFNTFDPRYFKQSDLDRIWRDEAVWMKNTAGVFFESAWGMREAKEAYQLYGKNFVCVGRGENALKEKSTKAIYFEYCEKWLNRIQPPQELLAFIDSFEYEIFFCRQDDLKHHGGASHVYKSDNHSPGLHLRSIVECKIPDTTDLLALPRGRVTAV